MDAAINIPRQSETAGSPRGTCEARAGVRHQTEGPVYLSIDLDALDPAHAPGVSHRGPGGLTVRNAAAAGLAVAAVKRKNARH